MSPPTTCQPNFQRIAILNRGEPAMRFLRAVRDYNLERGTELQALAFFTDPDAGAPFVRGADDAVRLGPAFRLGSDGKSISAYCDHDHVLALLRAARCDAVWPGWGFISEDADFVERLQHAGIAFLGPSAAAMRQLGDKIASKQLAEQAGVPLAPWQLIDGSEDDVTLLAMAERIGWPLMVKASGGGGGRGIRRVDQAVDLVAAVRAVTEEVRKIFGKGGLFLEACITGARHVEVQLVVGADGRARALGIRDCSVQRRNQKVVEEAPSPVLPAAEASRIQRASERLAELAEYQGVATAEYLYRPQDGALCFLEVNSRLQVEHTVTEMVSGADLVQAQIDIARGLPWRDPGDHVHGHAVEVRLNAEDPERGFAPAPGVVRVFRAPAGPGIRVDSGVVEGMTIAPEFDSMIAKLIAWAPTRPQALARLQRALQELQVVVEDGATNRAFLLDLLKNPEIVSARADTGWLDRAMAKGEFGTPAHAFEALLFAAVVGWRAQRHADVQRFFAQAQGGIPHQLPAPSGLAVDVRLRGEAHPLRVHAMARDEYLVGTDGALHHLHVEATGTHSALLHIAGRRHQVLYAQGRTGVAVQIDGATHVVERASGGMVMAPAPAIVVHVAVQEGDRIQIGDRLCTLEAMKMEMPLFAVESGIVQSVLCRPNQQVVAGQALVLLAPEASTDQAVQVATAMAPAPLPRPLDRLVQGDKLRTDRLDAMDEDVATAVILDLRAALHALLLGYDTPEADAARFERIIGRDFDLRQARHPARWLPLVHLLADFASVESLFERNLLPLAREAAAVTAEVAFYEYCRRHHEGDPAVQSELRAVLSQALDAYGVHSFEPCEDLRNVLWRMAVAHAHGDRRHRLCAALLRLAMEMHSVGVAVAEIPGFRDVLDRVAQVASAEHPAVADHARQAAYLLFEQSRYVQRREVVEALIDSVLAQHAAGTATARLDILDPLVHAPHTLFPLLVRRADPSTAVGAPLAEVLLRRLYQDRMPRLLHVTASDTAVVVAIAVVDGATTEHVLGVVAANVADAVSALTAAVRSENKEMRALSDSVTSVRWSADVTICGAGPAQDQAESDRMVAQIADLAAARLTLSWLDPTDRPRHRTWSTAVDRLVEDTNLRDIHPEAARRFELRRLSEFELERLDGPEAIVAFRGRARTNPKDERVFVFAEVREVPLAAQTAQNEGAGQVLGRDSRGWDIEQAWFEALRVLREAQAERDPHNRLHWNRITFVVRPVMRLTARDVARIAQRLEAPARGLGLEKVVIRVRVPDARGQGVRTTLLVISKPGRHRMQVEEKPLADLPVHALTPYELRVVRARRQGSAYPYELVRLLEGQASGGALPHPDMANGRFAEYDLDATGNRLQPVHRPYGANEAGVVVGIMVHWTAKYPDGMERVWLASDPTMAMGALAEAECRRIIAALDLAEERGLPVEWLPVSSGARIAMDSGTENLDWTARVLRRIIEFTQRGGDIHVIVAGINVGAQSYWNAEATMLMHTRGALIMTPDGAMVLTGKKALEVSGGVGAEDERGIGGVERIMGPNGQAHYVARDMGEALATLFEHYRFCYRKANEPGPRSLPSTDPESRSILDAPYRAVHGETFRTIGEIFDDRWNPGRKKPFAIREVMAAVIDRDGGCLERWRTMRHAETAVVWDAHLGGLPVTMIGFESRPLPRPGRIPLDGPDTWTGGTLFPASSKKVARALNAASGVRPVVVLANLSGFDGSPESLRKLQLEFGAEIGRAVVNFQGPIVFVVVGRYHGGAYVVFSKALNPNLTALALQGSYASVIGGGPAAAVVFPREVRKRAESDPRVLAARAEAEAAPLSRRPRLREKMEAILADVILEKQGEVAQEFDAVHSVDRAVRVGSLDAVIAAERLRPEVIERLRAAAGDTRVSVEWQRQPALAAG